LRHRIGMQSNQTDRTPTRFVHRKCKFGFHAHYGVSIDRSITDGQVTTVRVCECQLCGKRWASQIPPMRMADLISGSVAT